MGIKPLNTNKILSEEGIILISVPIEMGLCLIIKEIHRIKRRKFEYKPFEFIKAAFLVIPGKRICNSDGSYYGSHKGFDFRKLIKYIRTNGWEANVVGYGPIPIKTWYINSQVFIKVRKKKI